MFYIVFGPRVVVVICLSLFGARTDNHLSRPARFYVRNVYAAFSTDSVAYGSYISSCDLDLHRLATVGALAEQHVEALPRRSHAPQPLCARKQ